MIRGGSEKVREGQRRSGRVREFSETNQGYRLWKVRFEETESTSVLTVKAQHNSCLQNGVRQVPLFGAQLSVLGLLWQQTGKNVASPFLGAAPNWKLKVESHN